MKGAILDKGEPYFTNLSKVFAGINQEQKKYNWLITDCVCYPQSSEFSELLSRQYCWISGSELSKIVESEHFQWIGAVLSGFEKNVTLDEVLKYNLPYANDYDGFWNNPVSIQHPMASVEIVPWDSSLTLVISKNEKLVVDFMKAFPLSEDLETYNG